MSETIIIVSPDGDVSLPSEIRDELRWDPGTRLVLERSGDAVVLRSESKEPLFPPTNPADVFGMLKYDGPPATIEDMDRAIEEEVRRHYARGGY